MAGMVPCSRKQSGRMRSHLKARYLVPALVALVMIIYGAVTSVRNTRAILEDAKGVDQTHRVMIELENCLIAVLNLETGHRGFVITGQESYLAPYYTAVREVDRRVDSLDELTRQSPIQQDRMKRVRDAVQFTKQELARGIEARRTQGFEAAAAMVGTGAGRTRMDEIRELIEAMRFEEENLLAERRDQLTLELAILADKKTAKVIALLEEMRRDAPALADRADPESEAMARPADPREVLTAIDRRTPGSSRS